MTERNRSRERLEQRNTRAEITQHWLITWSEIKGGVKLGRKDRRTDKMSREN